MSQAYDVTYSAVEHARACVCAMQARYVVERGDAALWHKVLDENNPDRKSLVDQVR